MRRLVLCGTLVVLAIMAALPQPVSAGMAVGRVTMRVLRSLAIESLSDLSFPDAQKGAPAATVNAGPDSPCGSFVVKGEPNSSFMILLPNEAVLTTGDGVGPEKQIRVSGFQTVMEQGSMVGADGTQKVFIGATRDALHANQQEGVYSGDYTVEIVYQ